MTPSAADSFLAEGNMPHTILRAALVGVLWMSPAVRGDDGVPSRTATGQRPNIILCMTDDQGWGDVSYNGLKQIKTPALDAMAAAGVRFNRFYAAHPSCSPTRASVMTGRHPYRMGVFWPGVAIRTREVTIAQAVKTAGYATGHFGKWHLNGVAGPGKVIPNSDPCSPRNLGFDESFSVSNYFETNWTFGRNGVLEKTTGDGSDVIVAEVLKFIEGNAKRNKPFLAVVWFGSPHVPHKPLPEDLQRAGDSAYYGELVGVDRSMGTLRSGLRKLGIAENTMVWFCSDNGSWLDAKAPDAHGSNGPLRGKKGELWEGGIRVPGLIEWPARIRRPVVSDVPVCTSDIYPTIVEILNLKVANQVQPLDGISLVPLLDGKMKERPRPIGFWHPDGNKVMGELAAWNDNRYKLLTLPGKRSELYDLTVDPGEKTDIAAQHPELVARMKAELETWQQSVRRSNRGEDYPSKDETSAEETATPAEDENVPVKSRPEGHAKNRQRAASAHEANLKKYKDDKDVLVLPGLVADKKRQRVEVLVESTGLRQEAPCEFTIIDETSEHGYEALLMSLAKPSAIHRAVKFIGREPGEPFDPESLRFWAKGEPFVLSLVEDKKRPVRLEQLLIDRRTGKPLPERGFLFTGSQMVPDSDEPKKQVYAADYYQPKAIVSLFNSTFSVLEVPYRAPKSEVYQNTVVNPDHAFPEGTLLTLVIEPLDKEHARRVKDLVLRVEPGGSAAAPAASGVERLNRLRLQLKDAATVLNAQPTLASLFEALAALDKKHEYFLKVSFGDEVELGDAKLLARILSVTDSEKGIRIDPPPAGQLYYGAFLPNPDLLDRDARMDHPWELCLTEKDGKVSGKLLRVESVWKDGSSKPELRFTELPVADAKDLRRELDAEAEATKKAGRMARPAAILVFAPPTLKCGQLTKYLGTALSTHKMLQVYVDVPQPPIRKAGR